MANRLFKQFVNTLEAGVVKLYGSVTFGSSGAVSSQTSKGFTVTIVDSEAGRYLVTLEDSYSQFLCCNVVTELAADAAAGTDGYIPAVRNVSVADSTPTFQIQFTDAAGADVDPASGFKAHIEITLKNSSAY